MKFVLLIILPIILSVIVGLVTNFWLWGVLSFPVAMLICNWIAVALFGRPNDNELRRITYRPISEDLSEKELSLEARQIASRFVKKSSSNGPLTSDTTNQNDLPKDDKFIPDINIDTLNRVSEIAREHFAEVTNFWNSVDIPHKEQILNIFYESLRDESPIEYSELFHTSNKAINISCGNWTQKAYLTGYMANKGWISQEEMINSAHAFAEWLVDDIRKVNVNTKCRKTRVALAMIKVSDLTRQATREIRIFKK